MKNPRLRFCLRLLISGALIFLLLSRLDWAAVSRLLRGTNPWPLLAGIILTVVSQLLMAERTRLVLRHWAVPLTRREAAAVTWIGQFCNNFLPGGMGGDMVKFYRVCRLHLHSRAAILVALVADRLLALAALVTLSAGALACGDRGLLRQMVGKWPPDAINGRLPPWAMICMAATIVGSVLVGLWVWRFRQIIVEKGTTHFQSIRDALAKGRRFDGGIAVAFVLALLIHSIGIFCTWLYAWALAIPFHLGQVFLVWPMVLVAMMLPVSVNGHGLREFILLYYFERWGLASHLVSGVGLKESVVALSLLSILSDLLCNLPGGLLLLSAASRQKYTVTGNSDRSVIGPVRQ